MKTLRQELPVVVLLSRFTVAALQPSVAVGAVNTGVAVQSMVPLAPALPIVGACAPAFSREKPNKKTIHETKQSTTRRGSFLFPWVEENLNGL